MGMSRCKSWQMRPHLFWILSGEGAEIEPKLRPKLPKLPSLVPGGQWWTSGVRSHCHRTEMVQRFQAQLRDPCASEDIFQMSPYSSFWSHLLLLLLLLLLAAEHLLIDWCYFCLVVCSLWHLRLNQVKSKKTNETNRTSLSGVKKTMPLWYYNLISHYIILVLILYWSYGFWYSFFNLTKSSGHSSEIGLRLCFGQEITRISG